MDLHGGRKERTEGIIRRGGQPGLRRVGAIEKERLKRGDKTVKERRVKNEIMSDGRTDRERALYRKDSLVGTRSTETEKRNSRGWKHRRIQIVDR